MPLTYDGMTIPGSQDRPMPAGSALAGSSVVILPPATATTRGISPSQPGRLGSVDRMENTSTRTRTARQHGRDRGTGTQALAKRADPAGAGELPEPTRPAHIIAMARVCGRLRQQSTPTSGSSRRIRRHAITAATSEIIQGTRPLPAGRVPDRFGHQQQHEHERGACLTLAERTQVRVHPTTTSTPASRATILSRPPSRSRRGSRDTGRTVRRWVSWRAVVGGQRPSSSRMILRSSRARPTWMPPGDAGAGVRQIRRHRSAGGIERVRNALPRVAELPLGRNRGGHRDAYPCRLRASRHFAPARTDRLAVHQTQPLRGPRGGQGFARGAFRASCAPSPSA